MRIVIAMLSILFCASVAMVVLMNPEPVNVVLWPSDPEYFFPGTPVSWVIFFSAAAGAVFTGIIAVLEGAKTRLACSRMKSQIKKLQQEIEVLRRPSLDFSRSPLPNVGPIAVTVGDDSSPGGAAEDEDSIAGA
jgi:hypothetical protein